jgi:hypothetical protein
MATAKRTLTATAPDGEIVTVNVGPKRQVGAIRITDASSRGGWGDGSKWLVTVHQTLELAVTGPNQTPAWNSFPRFATAIDAADQPGEWFGASK